MSEVEIEAMIYVYQVFGVQLSGIKSYLAPFVCVTVWAGVFIASTFC